MTREFYAIKHDPDPKKTSEIWGPYGFSDQADQKAKKEGGFVVESRRLEPRRSA